MKKSITILQLLFIVMTLFTACNKSGYRNDGKLVTWQSEYDSIAVKDADPKTFKVIGWVYGKDANHVFFAGRIVQDADVATFKYIDRRYAKDAFHVFHCDSIMHGADPKTFKVHADLLTEDANDYYWNGEPIHVADKATFVVLSDSPEFIDFANWGKDKYNGYCFHYSGATTIPNIDYESFHRIIPSNSLNEEHYAADKFRVYFHADVVEGADPETFQLVTDDIGKDKHHVYYKGKATNVQDYNKLTKIGNHFYTDGEHLFTWELKDVNDADPRTFRALDTISMYPDWYADKYHVFWLEHIVKEADVSTFQPLYSYSYIDEQKVQNQYPDDNYGKDAYHVFYRDSLIKGADPATFEKVIIDDTTWTVSDKYRSYGDPSMLQLREALRGISVSQ